MGCGASAASQKYSSGDGGAAQDSEKTKQQYKDGNADFQETMQFLNKVPLLKRLPADQQPLLAAACLTAYFQKGDVVITQGEQGDDFYMIKAGQANVLVDGEQKATLNPGDYVGEQALLSSEPRSATITAETALTLLKITRGKFMELGLGDKVAFVNRKAVGGGGGRTLETKPPTPKTPEERQSMAQALLANQYLSTMVVLDDARINAMIDVAWKEQIAVGQDVITEGDITADYFYLVQEGNFDVHVGGEVVCREGPGGSFGELALLCLAPRAATVKATSNAVLWVIDRGNFKNILMKTTDAQLRRYVELLNAVEVLNPLLQEEKKAMAQALIEMHFTQDEVIVQQGDPGSTFYILYEGEVTVVIDDNEVARLAATGPGGQPRPFGERALLENEPRAATVVVVSETAKVLALDRDSFNMLLGPLEAIIREAQNGGQRTNMAKGKGAPGVQGADMKANVSKSDLRKIGLLGCGGFGAVELWEHKQTGETFALKGLSKGFIVRTGMQEAVINEKNILMMTSSSFIIRLYATYNSSQFLYFLMEAALGGELYATYQKKHLGLHGSEKHARYYLAGVIFAFEHCHDRYIIYRDLKPENLLFTEHGHIKLTDMGLAKFVIGKTFTTCGTPDYFAPELISSEGHTKAVDWWTLGILLFELLTEHPPFESQYPMQIYSKVLKGVKKMAFPPTCNGAAEQLVRALLEKDPSERLPMRPGGTANLKKHAWYKNFDWDAMFNLTLEAPYKPAVKSKKDLANFNARKEDMPRQVDYRDDGIGWDKDFATNR